MDYLKIYNTLDSTNLEAQRLLGAGPVPNGLTIIAIEQTQGRGQMGRMWIAQPGQHLSMSIIYRPYNMDPASLPTLGMKISLGIADGLVSVHPGLQPQIKWPNDIYVKDKKLCGILIENSLAGGKVQHSIIGIGININEESFPPELPNAISLHLLSGEKYNLKDVALAIREHVLDVLKLSSPQWKERYDQLVFGKEKSYAFITGDQTFNATVIGVSDEGYLRLVTDDGQSKSFASHAVKWKVI
jgi:BirA family biotin operon repressor/biotin-[acetyl-CoA-carboxylase] ligase